MPELGRIASLLAPFRAVSARCEWLEKKSGDCGDGQKGKAAHGDDVPVGGPKRSVNNLSVFILVVFRDSQISPYITA